jgi:hypothetical protein
VAAIDIAPQPSTAPVAVIPTPSQPQPAQPEPSTTPVEPPASKPAFIFAESAEEVFETNDLLSLGMHGLETHQYELARDAFLKAGRQLGPPGTAIEPAEELTMHGLGVAYLGLKQPKAAYEPLNRLYRNHPQSDSVALNWALANYLLDQQRGDSLLAVEEVLLRAPTELAVDLMDAMLAKWGRALNAEARSRFEQAKTRGTEALTAAHPGQKRWGTRWLSEEEYDERVRNEVTAASLADSITRYKEEVRRGEMRLRAAQDRNRASEIAEAQTSLDTWKTTLAEAETVLTSLQEKVPETESRSAIAPAMPTVPPGIEIKR